MSLNNSVRSVLTLQLKPVEPVLSSGNSTEDERDSHREGITVGSVSSQDMSSFYFSSHPHREGGKPRGRPPFSYKSKPIGDNKRSRGIGRASARPAIREREQYSERRTEFDPVQHRKIPHFQRHSGEGLRHQARHGSPVRNTRFLEESTESIKLSPAREPVSKRYQHADEPASKAAKVIAHRRDAPREKQRLTQDLARQKRLLSEDIARAELLQREQLTKKLVDIFENRKESPGGERVVEMEETKVVKENVPGNPCNAENSDRGTSMFEQGYSAHSPEYINELTTEREFQTSEENNDKISKRAQERESLFDRLLPKRRVKGIKNIEFVNESKVEVKEMHHSIDSHLSPKSNLSPLPDHVMSCDSDSKRELDLEPLTFENVSDDELPFSDGDAQASIVKNNICNDRLQQNGQSPTFPKKITAAENGIESETEASCNGLEESCDAIEPSATNDSGSRNGNVFNNLAQYESCECPSEDGDLNCENNVTVSSAPVMFDAAEYVKSIDMGVGEPSDHSTIKSSKLARLMEEPDMQCEHSSKHEDECVTQDGEVSSWGIVEELNVGSSHERDHESTCGMIDPWNNHVPVYEACDSRFAIPSEKETVTTKEKQKDESEIAGKSDRLVVERNVGKKESQSFGQREKETSDKNEHINEQIVDTVATESELSNIEGMSDAGELSEPEQALLLIRGKVKKKKRKKPKSTKMIHRSVVISPRRKAKGSKGRSSAKTAKPAKRIKTLDSESDEATLRSKSQDMQSSSNVGDANSYVDKVESPNNFETNSAMPTREGNSSLRDSNDDERENSVDYEKRNSEFSCLREGKFAGKEDNFERGNNQSGSEEHFAFEDIVVTGIASDNCDSGQDASSLSDPQTSATKEERKPDDAKKEKRLGIRQKRKSDEKEKERERSTPPHLISQNRYARDLPRHNWLVELLLQQKKLCTEDTLQEARASKGEQSGKEESHPRKEEQLTLSGDKQGVSTSQIELVEQTELPAPPLKQSCHDEPPASPHRDSFQTELHRSFLRRSFPSNVPRTLPPLKPSSPDSSLGNESVVKPVESKGPPPPPLKHALPLTDPSGLEPLSKMRKIIDDAERKSSSQTEESVGTENPHGSKEFASSEVEHCRKVITPIEILDDDEEKKKHVQDQTNAPSEPSSPTDIPPCSSHYSDSNQNEGRQSPIKTSSVSPQRKPTSLNSLKKPFSAVTPTIPGSIKDNLGRPMHMPPHRAAILIPVVPMHDGSGIRMPTGLGPTSPHMKGYSPRTFTPHLITHSAPMPASGIFGSPLSQASRFSANACGHHMHGNMTSGVPCKRDVNCPFHGNNPRGLPSGILSISHHGPMHAFGRHGHDHPSAVMSRDRRENDKGLCPQPDCRTCQSEKPSPPGRDHMSDKFPFQGPKVVKPIAHVPNKRPPLMLSHLQQLGKPSPATLRDVDTFHDDKGRRLGGELLLSPHQLQKPAEKSPREQMMPAMSPLHERIPIHQPLTLSDLNRRREEEMIRAKAEDSFKSKSLPGEFIIPGLGMPSPSLGIAKYTPLSHSKESVLLSPGRSQGSTSFSTPEKREPGLLIRRNGTERDREHTTFNSDFLKPGPPRLRPLDESDVRLSSDRQRREDQLFIGRGNSSFLRLQPAKDSTLHPGKLTEEKEGSNSHGVDLLGGGGRPGRDTDGSAVHSAGSHGNSGIMNMGLRHLDEPRTHSEDGRQSGGREQPRVRERTSPEPEHRLRLEPPGDHQVRRRSLELLQVKEKDPRSEPREKESIRIPVPDREHSDELSLLRPGGENSPSRMSFDRSSPVRHKMYPDRPFPGLSSRMEGRLDPRFLALHEMEMHRRGEAIRTSEPSHRELLSRMASSIPMSKSGPPFGKSFLVRSDGFLERRGTNSTRLPSEIRGWSPPTSVASRDYGMVMNSRQAMERLAAAAGKPGPLLGEVGKDVPIHIRQVRLTHTIVT